MVVATASAHYIALKSAFFISLWNPRPLQHACGAPLDAALAGPRHLPPTLFDHPQPRTFAQTANLNHTQCPTRPALETDNPSIAHLVHPESNCRMWESKIK
jgi:hypothetical protein